MVCSLFGFALAIVLLSIFALWLLGIIIYICLDLKETVGNIFLSIFYVFVPYAGLIVFRVYVLHKAQAFRRDAKRTHDFRNLKTGEHTRLVRHRQGVPDVRP